jgi:hypothetical protein
MGRIGIKEQDAIIKAQEILNDSSGKYIGFLYDENNKLLIEFKCSCSRNYKLSLNRLKASRGFCPECRYERMSKKRSYTVEELQKIYYEHDCIFDIVSYIDNYHKIKFTCSCGNPNGYKMFNDFINSPRCKECGVLSSTSTRKTKFKDVLEIYKSNDCILLLKEKDYIDTHTYASFICSCGRLGNKMITTFNLKPWCKECGFEIKQDKNRTSYEEMYKFISLNSKCELITPKELFVNSQTNIELKCECNKPFITTFINFKHENKRQCNECGIKTKSGENHPNWKGVNS